MGFVIPASIRFASRWRRPVPGTCTFVCRLATLLARRRGRGRRRDDSAVADPPSHAPLPPRPEPPWTRSSARRRRTRARERRRCTRARRRRDRRPTGGRAPPPRPAPSRLGTLRPEDHRGAHPPGASTPRSSATSGAIPRRQPRATRTLHKPRNPRPRSDGARWRWTTPARRGTHGRARQPGRVVRLRARILANVPFTPGGAGWETAAAEASAAREASARHASVGWLAEYEAGVFSGTPGFDPSPWADPPAAAEANRDVDHDRDRAAALTHDDLLLDAIRGANVEDAASPDEDDSDDSDDSDETSDDDASDDDASAERPAETVDLDPEAELEALLRSVDPRAARSARRVRGSSRGDGRTPAGISGR